MSTAMETAGDIRRISRFTLALYAVLAATVAAVVIAWMATGRPWYDALGWSLRWVVRFRQGADSWGPMQEAIEFARNSPDGGLYDEIFFQRLRKFQYPPTSLLLIWDLTRVQLKTISLALLAANIAAVWAIVESSLRLHGHPAAAGRTDRLLRGGAVAGLMLTFYPLTVAFALGQIQTWVNAGFALLVLAWMRGRGAPGGSVLGLLTWIKPQYALLAIWAVRARAGSFVSAAFAVGLVGLAAAVWRFGVAEHFAYLRVLRHLARHGEAFYANQSINGFLHRAFGNGSSVHFDAASFPPFHPIVHWLTIAAFLALVVVALLAPIKLKQSGTAADLAFFTIVMTVTAPIAWEHHYGVIPPVLAAAVVPFVQHRGKCDTLLLGVSWVLLAVVMLPASAVADRPWNAIQSYRLFGALMLAALLLRHMWCMRRQPEAAYGLGGGPDTAR
jgi:hypothetical protein